VIRSNDPRGPIIIQGPGAIGRLLASRLDRAGHAVQLLGRHGSRSEIDPGPRKRSVLLHENGRRTHKASLLHRLPGESLPRSGSLLIVTTKAFDVREAIREGLRSVTPTAPILILSNGLGHDETLAELTEIRPTLLGTIACGAWATGDLAVEDGEVHCVGDGPVVIGPSPAGDPIDASRVADLLRSAGFDAHSTADGRRAQWLKAALNCGLNPVATLLGSPNGEIPGSNYFSWAVEAARETALVGRATGLDLPESGWRSRLEELCSATAPNRCSMLQDLDAGRQLEIDHLNEWVARRANRLQVPAPRNRRLASAFAGDSRTLVRQFREALRQDGVSPVPSIEGTEPVHRTAEAEIGS